MVNSVRKTVSGVALLLLVMSVSSCGIFSPNLARRHRNTSSTNLVDKIGGDPQTFVNAEMNSYIAPAVASTKVQFNLLSLSDRGQEAYINAASRLATDAGGLSKIVNTNFNFDKAAVPSITYVSKTVKRSLVFTVQKHEYSFEGNAVVFNIPGGRIANLGLEVQIDGDKLKFRSWDKFVSDVLTLNLGSVSSAQKWSANLNLSAKGTGEVSLNGSDSTEGGSTATDGLTHTVVNGGITTVNNNQMVRSDKDSGSTSTGVKGTTELGGSASAGYEGNYQTTLNLNPQILKLSGTLRDNGRSISLLQESGPSIDLSGNVNLSVEYELQDDWAMPAQFIKVKNLYDTSLKPKPVDSLKISTGIVFFPDIQQDIHGRLNYQFLYRQVRGGERHLPEARQKVKLLAGSVPYDNNKHHKDNPVILVRKEDIRPKSYQLEKGGVILKLKNNELKFESFNEAASFMQYLVDLRDTGANLSGVTISGTAVAAPDFTTLRITTKQL